MKALLYVGVIKHNQAYIWVNKPTTRQTSDMNDFVNVKSHTREKPLLAGYGMRRSISTKKRLMSQGM